MKTLSFRYFGRDYLVNESGHIKANGLPYFSPQWIFLGGSKHYRRNGIDISLKAAFADPKQLNGCYGWDQDHGTVRQWRSGSRGSITRISGAHILNTDAAP